ncbi:MAG TPA: PQQ-binding-like beta-propeller repeat protein [Abditibacteriaceae bacterium]|jgi:outer membrane protein assembly factor BamB
MRHSALIFCMALAFHSVSAVAPAEAATEAWTMWKGDPQRTGTSEATYTLPLNLMWRHSTEEVGSPRGLYPPLIVGPAGDRRAYFVAGRTLFCVNAQNGNLIWKSQEKDIPGSQGAPLTLLPSQNGDVILVLTSKGELLAFRTSDGGRAWEGKAPGSVQGGAPTLAQTPNGERILVFTTTGRVVGFTREGDIDSKYGYDLGRRNTAITATPAISPDGTKMFFPATDKKFYVFNIADGKEIYNTPIGGTSFESPLLLGDKVVIAVGEEVRAYNQRTGQPVWNFRTKGRVLTSPVGRLTNGGQGRVYAGTERGLLYAIDLNNGRALWPEGIELARGRRLGNITLLDDMIVVGGKNDVLYALNPNDGRILWQYRMETQRVIEPAADNQVMVDQGGGFGGEGGPPPGGGRGDGGEGGPAPGADPVGPQILTYGVSAAPVAVDGQLFVLGDNAALYAFESTPFDAVAPYAAQPSLALMSAEKTFEAFALDPDEPLVVPGTGPVAFGVTLTDPGSGIVPESIKVLVNAQAVPPDPKRMSYNPGEGVLSVNLIENKPGQRPVLADGVYTIAVSAQDYRGNEMNYTGTFTVDRNAPAPTKIPPVEIIGGGEPGFGGSSSPGFGGSSSPGSGSGRPGMGRPGMGSSGSGRPGGRPRGRQSGD